MYLLSKVVYLFSNVKLSMLFQNTLHAVRKTIWWRNMLMEKHSVTFSHIISKVSYLMSKSSIWNINRLQFNHNWEKYDPAAPSIYTFFPSWLTNKCIFQHADVNNKLQQLVFNNKHRDNEVHSAECCSFKTLNCIIKHLSAARLQLQEIKLKKRI